MPIPEIAITVGKTVGPVILKQVLGVNLKGRTLDAWGQQIVLGLFLGKGLVPGATFQQEVNAKLDAFNKTLGEVKVELASLQKEFKSFAWTVDKRFMDQDEKDHWLKINDIENSVDSAATETTKNIKESKKLENQSVIALNAAKEIMGPPSRYSPYLRDIRDRLLGPSVGSVSYPGLIDIWRGQALQEANALGLMEVKNTMARWEPKPPESKLALIRIYSLLVDKFSSALLVQGRCGRLLADAAGALNKANPSANPQTVEAFFTQTFYPYLVEEVRAFRNMVEELCVNLLPMPVIATGHFSIPPDVAAILTHVDRFAAQLLGGQIKAYDKNDRGTSGVKLPEAPILQSVWGRFIIPSRRWIGRKTGTSEAAFVAFGGILIPGRLELRAAAYFPQDDAAGKKTNSGYVLTRGGDVQPMDSMLIAHFSPTEVLPENRGFVMPVPKFGAAGNIVGVEIQPLDLNVVLLDAAHRPLGTAIARFAQVDEPDGSFVFGSFNSMFTGGLDIRAKQ